MHEYEKGKLNMKKTVLQKPLQTVVKIISIFFSLCKWQSLKLVAFLDIFGYLCNRGISCLPSLSAREHQILGQIH